MAEKTIEQPSEKVLVTARDTAPSENVVLRTQPGAADVQVVTMTWYGQVAIRVLRTYLQGLLGFILTLASPAGEAVGIKLPVMDFAGVLVTSASLAIAPAAISLLQNAIEILTKLDSSSPKLRA